MAFITNQNKDGATTLAKRLTELVSHADQLDMLVGFFYFSGVKVLAEALRDRPRLKMRVLVGMDAEYAVGQLVEVVQKGGADSAEAIQERFFESMKKILGSPVVDTQAFHERVGIFIDLLETKRLEVRKTRDPNHAKLYIFAMDEAQENLYQMLRSKLVQRFESSFGAFKMSVKSVKRSLELSLKFVERMNTFLYSRKAMDRILAIDDYEDAVAAMLEAIRDLEEMYEKKGVKTKNAIFYDIAAKNFDGKRFIADIKEDVALMEKILEEVETLKLDAKDPKAATLVGFLTDVLGGTHADIPVETESPRRKIIVFSSFKDTIVHIAKWVEKAFPGRVLVVTGDNFGKEMARSVKENFDASFDVQTDDFDILLTTDKLSEGFNLNRAGLVVNYDIPWNPTRVIQRVGRINRIGKKVFDNLFIFNFFPTVKGSTIVANRAIAENKMFAIHQILGEDAKIFSIEEEPTPAGLYSKVSSFGDEEAMNFYTDAKIKYQRARTFLGHHLRTDAFV